jgi:hypothetical protein
MARTGPAGYVMAIYRLFQIQAFEPEDLQRMGEAYEQALVVLGLTNYEDPLTETVARHIIEFARTGEKDPARICAAAVRRVQRELLPGR